MAHDKKAPKTPQIDKEIEEKMKQKAEEGCPFC